MKTYHCKFLRVFDATVTAEDMKAAETAAADIVKQFPAGTCKMLSIYDADYKEPPEPEAPPKKPPPGGNPVGGGTPGTPVVRLPEPLVDQVAEAA